MIFRYLDHLLVDGERIEHSHQSICLYMASDPGLHQVIRLRVRCRDNQPGTRFPLLDGARYRANDVKGERHALAHLTAREPYLES